MGFVPDTNIIISGFISPEGINARLILKDLKGEELIWPEFLLQELLTKIDKITKLTGLSNDQVKELVLRFIKKIDFINDELIDQSFQEESYELVKEIDKKDLLFVALSLQSEYPLWSGDKKLMTGLRKKQFKGLFDTRQIIESFK